MKHSLPVKIRALLASTLLLCGLQPVFAQKQNKVVNGPAGNVTSSTTPQSIVNGQVVNITDAPWQVSLQRRLGPASNTTRATLEGGGCILNPYWVLTAAHVVNAFPAADFWVAAGSNNAYHSLDNNPPDGQLIHVAQIILLPGYNRSTFENDLALVRLATPLRLNSTVQPIQFATELNLPDNAIAPGTNTSLTGWGSTYYSNASQVPISPVLRGTDVPIISNAAANQVFQQQTGSTATVVFDKMMAVYGPGSGKGYGFYDTGGPMVVINNGVPIVAGIMLCSGLGPNPNTNPTLGQSPTVGTSVKAYSSWIQDNMAPNSWNFQAQVGNTVSQTSVRFVCRNSGKVLEVAGAYPNFDYNAGAPVQQRTKAGNQRYSEPLNQQWNLINLNNGYYGIRVKASNLALQIDGAATTDAAVATQGRYTGAYNQQWRIESVGDGYYKIFARHSGKALEIGGFSTAEGAPASQYTYAGGANQQWAIEDITTYGIAPGHTSGARLGATGTSPGAPVVQTYNMPYENIDWQVVSTGAGTYKIVSQATDQVLEIGGGPSATNLGLTANLWPYVGGANQKWQLERVGPYDNFHLIAQHSGQALEVGASSTAEGASVNQWEYNATANQIWSIGNTGSFANRVTSPLAATSTQDGEHLAVFPNPASSRITIVLPTAGKGVSATVTDIQGRHITTAFTTADNSIDISSLAPGTYLVRATDGVREYHQRFVKE